MVVLDSVIEDLLYLKKELHHSRGSSFIPPRDNKLKLRSRVYTVGKKVLFS
jgi:hypothetical protein